VRRRSSLATAHRQHCAAPLPRTAIIFSSSPALLDAAYRRFALEGWRENSSTKALFMGGGGGATPAKTTFLS